MSPRRCALSAKAVLAEFDLSSDLRGALMSSTLVPWELDRG